MIVEWLRFRVPPSQRDLFLDKDKKIWTNTLQKYPGFVSKQIWLNPNQSEEIIIIIHWQNRELWKSIPEEDLAQIEQLFQLSSPNLKYELVESLEFEVF